MSNNRLETDLRTRSLGLRALSAQPSRYPAKSIPTQYDDYIITESTSCYPCREAVLS